MQHKWQLNEQIIILNPQMLIAVLMQANQQSSLITITFDSTYDNLTHIINSNNWMNCPNEALITANNIKVWLLK